MKKIKVLLSALAMVAAMAFVSCGGGAGDSTSAPAAGEPAKLISCHEYDATLEFANPVAEGSGYTDFHVLAKWEAADGIQAAVQLKNGNAQSSATVNLNKDYTEVTGKCFVGAKYKDWGNGGKDADCADGATLAQFYIQNSSYAAIDGNVYVKKIWFTGAGKDDLVVFEYTAE